MIDKDMEILICRKAIDTFGEAIQKLKAIEEISELNQALMLGLQGKQNNIEEEIADVEIMLMQLRLMYGSGTIEKELETVYDLVPPRVIEQCVNLFNVLVQHMCKELISEFRLDVRKIAYCISSIEVLKNKFNKKEIEEIKQEKLKRLEQIVYASSGNAKEVSE